MKVKVYRVINYLFGSTSISLWKKFKYLYTFISYASFLFSVIYTEIEIRFSIIQKLIYISLSSFMLPINHHNIKNYKWIFPNRLNCYFKINDWVELLFSLIIPETDHSAQNCTGSFLVYFSLCPSHNNMSFWLIFWTVAFVVSWLECAAPGDVLSDAQLLVGAWVVLGQILLQFP